VNASAFYLLHDGLLLGVFFDPEDERDMFLRNDIRLVKDYMEFYPRKQNSSYLITFRNIF
jgi:hypothetical protein